MALSANTVWEVRTTGSDTNGGGFVTGASGTDWSQQAAAQYSVTDAVGNGTTTVTSATANFGTDVVGNIVNIQSAWFQIISRTNATTIVVDRATGTFSGGTLIIGGAFASPGQAGLVMAAVGVAGMKIWIKTGTYTLTNTTVNTSNGPVQIVIGGTVGAPITWEGYNASRGDLGTPPILSAGTQNTFTIFGSDTTHSVNMIKNITVDGKGNTSVKGITDNGRRHAYYLCTAKNCTNNGIAISGGSLCVSCIATGCSTAAAFLLAAGDFYFCVAFSNTGVSGFSLTSGNAVCYYCLAYANTTSSGHGFSVAPSSGNGGGMLSCTAYGNGGDGFHTTNGEIEWVIANCIAEGNTGFGIGMGGSQRGGIIMNCATFNNASGGIDTNFIGLSLNNIAYTATAFVNAVGNNFSLNGSNPGGGQLRGVGFPGTLPDANVGFASIGALQPQAFIYPLFNGVTTPVMSKLSILAGSTSQSVNVFIQNSASAVGAGLTGLVFNSSGLIAYYTFAGANTTATAITLATLASVTAAYSSGGFIEIDSTHQPGLYRLDLPNAALASGKGRVVTIYLSGAANMAPCAFEIELTGLDNQVALPSNFSSLSINGSGQVTIAPSQLQIKKNTALNNFQFLMTSSTDDISPATGLTVTATRSIDGAAFAACANSVTELSNGVYTINLAATDLNGTVITLKFTATGALQRTITIVTQA